MLAFGGDQFERSKTGIGNDDDGPVCQPALGARKSPDSQNQITYNESRIKIEAAHLKERWTPDK
jgi:hypothetical protein